jgi:hypothetical protein
MTAGSPSTAPPRAKRAGALLGLVLVVVVLLVVASLFLHRFRPGADPSGRPLQPGGTASVGSAAAFTIGGDLTTELSPGARGPLDLTLANPAGGDISVTVLTVAVSAVRAPNAGPERPCSVADFAVDQFSGHLPIGASGPAARTLTELGVPAADLPVLRMRDTAVNQDGCKDATLTLRYTGTAVESSS